MRLLRQKYRRLSYKMATIFLMVMMERQILMIGDVFSYMLIVAVMGV